MNRVRIPAVYIVSPRRLEAVVAVGTPWQSRCGCHELETTGGRDNSGPRRDERPAKDGWRWPTTDGTSWHSSRLRFAHREIGLWLAALSLAVATTG